MEAVTTAADMTKTAYCDRCGGDDESTFTYCGNGDWQCEQGHLMPPDDAFRAFRADGTNGVGPFVVYLLDEPSQVMGFIHVHDRTGFYMETCRMNDDGVTHWTAGMFIPWARVRYARLAREDEEKAFRKVVHGSLSGE